MTGDLEIKADSKYLKLGAGADGQIGVNADNLIIKNVTKDKDQIFKVRSLAANFNGVDSFVAAGAAFGFATKDEGNTVLKVIANLQTRINELETKLTAYGLLNE